MISLEQCYGLLSKGFSLITVAENKIPNFSWKKYQSEQINKQTLQFQYNYKGGQIKKDGTEIPKTENIGIVTGYDYLECIDVDLKVFSTTRPVSRFLTRTRLKACPLPGLTNSFSTIL